MLHVKTTAEGGCATLDIPTNDIAQRALAGERFSRDELLSIAAQAQQRGGWNLLYQGHLVRQANFGRGVRLCAIVPGKLGNCTEDCRWCAQSACSAPGVTEPKRTSLDEICSAADEAAELGATNIGIVNSGKKPAQRDIDDVLAAANRVDQDENTQIELCASLGEMSDNQLAQLSASPIKRYHHNLETSRRFFPQMVTTHTYDEKLRTLRLARQAGLSICSGGLFGLGETWEDRIDLALTLRDEVSPDVVPLNFLVPIPGTTLKNAKPLAPLEILRIIAMYRIIMPDIDLKVAGGRETNLGDMQSWIFFAGATSIMVGKYLTTAGQSAGRDMKMIKNMGLHVVEQFEPQKP